jgi:hypothetical protein
MQRRPWPSGLLIAFLTLAAAEFEPFFQNAPMDQLYVNAVWNCLYGIGFEIAFFIYHDITLNRSAGILGFVVWPIIMFSLVAYLSRRIITAAWSPKVKYVLLAIFVGTLVINIPLREAAKSVWLPNFMGDFAANY